MAFSNLFKLFGSGATVGIILESCCSNESHIVISEYVKYLLNMVNRQILVHICRVRLLIPLHSEVRQSQGGGQNFRFAYFSLRTLVQEAFFFATTFRNGMLLGAIYYFDFGCRFSFLV